MEATWHISCRHQVSTDKWRKTDRRRVARVVRGHQVTRLLRIFLRVINYCVCWRMITAWQDSESSHPEDFAIFITLCFLRLTCPIWSGSCHKSDPVSALGHATHFWGHRYRRTITHQLNCTTVSECLLITLTSHYHTFALSMRPRPAFAFIQHGLFCFFHFSFLFFFWIS